MGQLTINPEHPDVEISKVIYNPNNGKIVGQDGSAIAISGVSPGTISTFSHGLVDSITLFNADFSAANFSSYLIHNIELIQTVPPQQPAGNYILNMTITAS